MNAVFLQERLKKEYRTANKQGDTGVDVTDDEDDSQGINKQAKAMQKLIRNREGNDAYESEDDKNPYASSVSTSFLPFSYTLYSFRKRRKKNLLFCPLQLPQFKNSSRKSNQKLRQRKQRLYLRGLLRLVCLGRGRCRRAYRQDKVGILLLRSVLLVPRFQSPSLRTLCVGALRLKDSRVQYRVQSPPMVSMGTLSRAPSNVKLTILQVRLLALVRTLNFRNRRSGRRSLKAHLFHLWNWNQCCLNGSRLQQMPPQGIAFIISRHIS